MAHEETAAPKAPAGTHDVLAPESARWAALVAGFAGLVGRSGFDLAITPVFEDVRVFTRGFGDSSDVVGKEMYEFEDRGGRRLALRPEGTAPMVRAWVQHRPPLPWKAWYVTPAFRYERPQAGRYRQHHQLGVEALGTPDPDLDVEVIALADAFFSGLGLSDVALSINSMGDAACRPAYLEVLVAYLGAHRDELCADHAVRMDEQPLRTFDCKRAECIAVTEGAPRLEDHLCAECGSHYRRVGEGLSALGVTYARNHRLVRGFDYYTRTTFEFSSLALESAQNGIGGGGRYDGLVEQLGGPPTPGIGFGVGIERVLLACDAEGVFAAPDPVCDVFVVDVTGGAEATAICALLRRTGRRVERAYDGRSLKAQLKAADRAGARVAVIVGQDELAEGVVTLRPMVGGEQRRVERDEIVEALDALDRTSKEQP